MRFGWRRPVRPSIPDLRCRADAAAWSQPHPAPLAFLTRTTCALLLVLAALVLTPRPLQAAPTTAPAPATEEQMALYTRIAAVNVCIARDADVDFDTAAAVAGETIAQVIQGQHGSMITVVGSEPLSPDDLRKGSINSAVLGAVEICPQLVPAPVLKSVQAALQQAAAQR